MAWYKKEQPTSFDKLAIDGLFFLSSDNPNLKDKGIFFEGQKRPMIAFPSGMLYAIHEADNPLYIGIIQLFEQLNLPYSSTRDEAYHVASEIAEYMGYAVFALEKDKLALHGFEEGQHLLVTYDNEAKHMLDIVPIRPHTKVKVPDNK